MVVAVIDWTQAQPVAITSRKLKSETSQFIVNFSTRKRQTIPPHFRWPFLGGNFIHFERVFDYAFAHRRQLYPARSHVLPLSQARLGMLFNLFPYY